MEAIVKARKDATAEERRVAAEERKVALEERKVSNEERTRLLEWEKHLFFLDTSNLNAAQKEYVNLAREEVLIQKRAMICAMGGGGLGGMRDMGGFEATMETMGGMGGFGAPPGAMAGMGGMSLASLMGGMGATPAAMGGMSFDVPPHTHSHEDAVEDLANTFRAPHDGAACDNEEKEEESSLDEEDESEEEERRRG